MTSRIRAALTRAQSEDEGAWLDAELAEWPWIALPFVMLFLVAIGGGS